MADEIELMVYRLVVLLIIPLILAAKDGGGPYRLEPIETDHPSIGVGQQVAGVAFTDIDGRPSRLGIGHNPPATVIVVRDTTCPITRRYGPTTARLEQHFAPLGTRFVYLNINQNDTPAMMREEIRQFGFKGPYVADHDHRIGLSLGVTSTAEVFVLDDRLRLTYRGAIDDQYGIGFSREQASKHYLRDALAATLENRKPSVAATVAPGCFVRLRTESSQAGLSWYRDIEAIVQDHCQECHRPGEIGPFPLLSHADVFARKEMIRFVLENRIMPPWFAAPGSGPWANSLQLSDADRASLLTWIDQGAPAGNPADGGPAREWSTGWRSGKPDAVLQVPDPIQVPAEGVIDYQYATIETQFAEDKWIQGFEVRTRVPRSAHHILMFLDEPEPEHAALFRFTGEDVKASVQMPGGWALDGYFAGAIVGVGGIHYPAGMAKRLPKGALIRVQLHYTASGIAGIDQPLIGLKFADEPPRQEIRTLAASRQLFRIPAHASNHAVDARFEFEEDGLVTGFLPHMHLRGKAFRYELERPDGSREVLLDIPRYDPNWQLAYQLQFPVEVSAGSILHATGWFDNSADNPANPDPNRSVGFGKQVWDEMMIGYFDWVTPNPDSDTASTAASF